MGDSHLEIDRTTGLVTNCSSVRVEGDSLAFSLSGARRDCEDRGGVRFDADLMTRFCGLVRVRNSGGRLGGSESHARMMDLAVPRGEGPQYSLADGTCKDILGLAREVGPLFGSYGANRSPAVDGEYREPIALWVQAAGVFSLAARLSYVLGERDHTDMLDDEVVFYALARKSPADGAGDPADLLTAAVFAKDDPLLPAYECMLTFDEGSRPRVFPVTSGTDRGLGTWMRANYGSISPLQVGRGPSDLARMMVRCLEAQEGRSFPLPYKAFKFVEARSALKSRRASLPGRGTICKRTVYAYRQRGDWGGVGLDATLLEDSAGERQLVATLFDNELPLQEDYRYGLYEDLYNGLINLHTWRVSPDLERGSRQAPVYLGAIDHLWCALARLGTDAPVIFCPNCGQPFLRQDRKQRYCSSACRDEYRRNREPRFNRAVDLALGWIGPNSPFTARMVAKILYHTLGYECSAEKVSGRLHEISGSKRAKIRVRSLGGAGTGTRWVVLG